MILGEAGRLAIRLERGSVDRVRVRNARAIYNGLRNGSGRSGRFTMACGTVPDAPGDLQWLAELFRTLRAIYNLFRNRSGRLGQLTISSGRRSERDVYSPKYIVKCLLDKDLEA